MEASNSAVTDTTIDSAESTESKVVRASSQSVNPWDWRCPPLGRPRHTWLRTLEADLQPHNLGLNSAWTYA